MTDEARFEGPAVEVTPAVVRVGARITIHGWNWGSCPVLVTIEGKPIGELRVTKGYPLPEGIAPAADGEIVAEVTTWTAPVGTHEITLTSAGRKEGRASATVEIVELSGPDPDRPEAESNMSYWRSRDFFDRRFGHLGFVPPGVRDAQVSSVRRLREQADRLGGGGEPKGGGVLDPSQPAPGVCNWTPVGPGPVIVGPGNAWSGRTISIAIDPVTPATMYVGTANGGVWKSLDGGTTWSPKADYVRSPAIGALAIDPNNTQRVFAGTGEYNNVAVGTYYGNGLLRSTTGGDAWTEIGTTTFERDEISRIVFNPLDPTSQSMFLSSSIGVYESPDGGTNWTQLRSGNASDLAVVVSGGNVKLVAAFNGSGLWTSTKSAGTWAPWSQITSPALPASGFTQIVFGQCRTQPDVIYALYASGSTLAGLFRTNNGGADWTLVDVRLNRSVGATSSSSAGHTHTVSVPAADMAAANAAHTYTTSSAGATPHTHSVSFTAAQFQQLASGMSVTVSTTADATGHQHTFSLAASGQAFYNLVVAAHPTQPNTVYLGEVLLWKNTTGGGVFTSLPVPHTDQQAFAFDPTNPEIVWACGDGGVFRSADGGATWANRNRDLATLQYISVSNHPQTDAALIGGTQDNGTQRALGSPAWNLVDGGDGGFTAIDQSNPMRMYHEYIRSIFYRSDSAGASGSWVQKGASITGASEFYAPFLLDPSNQNVCYFGGASLWRSPDNADTWTAITPALNGNATAIAVHPADSNTVYVATTTGRVYRAQKTGMNWDTTGVTLTDLTGAALPAGVSISDLAVDADGTVWVTTSAILWTESAGEFTNDHVYRRTTADTQWVSRSNGLAVANPINSIVIDPGNPNRLFCGGDVGVFRTEDAGANWVAWDQGLPNVPVFDLALHHPRRLLRAATHGRSVWERPIDVMSCPQVDLYVRDSVLDTGRVQPSPTGPHPFLPATNVYWWQSPDVKVDAPEPTYQTPAPQPDYVTVESLQHRTARRNRTNRFYVQVHNRGVVKASNVKVRAFFADASAGLPALPSDFWTAGKPFTGDPVSTAWSAVGATQTIPVLEPAEPGVVEWDWMVPGSAAQHSCLLVVTTCDEDALDGGGILDPGTLVTTRKQVALKNLHVENPVPGGVQEQEPYTIDLNNPRQDEAGFDVVFDWGSLPVEARIFLAVERLSWDERDPLESLETGDGVEWADEPPREVFREAVEDECGNERRFDMDRLLEVRWPERGRARLRGLSIPPGARRGLAFVVELPEGAEREESRFDVLQVGGKRIVGGSTYVFRPRDDKERDRDERKDPLYDSPL